MDFSSCMFSSAACQLSGFSKVCPILYFSWLPNLKSRMRSSLVSQVLCLSSQVYSWLFKECMSEVTAISCSLVAWLNAIFPGAPRLYPPLSCDSSSRKLHPSAFRQSRRASANCSLKDSPVMSFVRLYILDTKSHLSHASIDILLDRSPAFSHVSISSDIRRPVLPPTLNI